MDNTQDILERARADVAARRAAALTARSDEPWLWALAGSGLTLLLGLLLLPIGTLSDRLQLVVHGVCAQAHYLHVGALRLPLCARNTGIYAGFMGTLLCLMARGRGRAARLPHITITAVLMLGAIAMVADGVNSLLLDIGGYNVYTPRNELRVITGLLMGSAIGVFMLLMFNLALRRQPRTDQAIVSSWIEYVVLLLVNAGVYLLVFFGPAVLFYPLALFSVAGIVGVLFVANLFVMAMIGGWEGRVASLRGLARPATMSVVITALELAALAGLRVWVEGAMQMPM